MGIFGGINKSVNFTCSRNIALFGIELPQFKSVAPNSQSAKLGFKHNGLVIKGKNVFHTRKNEFFSVFNYNTVIFADIFFQTEHSLVLCLIYI